MTNALLQFQDRLNKETAGLEFYPWACQNIFTDRGGKLDFTEHPELVQIYQDPHPEKRIRKSVQVGASTYCISEICYQAVKKNRKAMYTGPDDGWMREFVKGRVNPLINNSPQIKAKIGDTNNAEHKIIGFGALHFAGLESIANTTSADIDFLVYDEFDLVNQDISYEALDRLEHSKYASIYYLSKPTVRDYGIDEAFAVSDQHFRLFKCPKCNTYNDVVSNIEQEPMAVIRQEKKKDGSFLYYFACENCAHPLDPAHAQWVAKYPDRKYRGYQLSQAYWVRKPARVSNVAEKLYFAFTEADTMKKKKRVWRSLLGLSFAGDEQPLTDEIFNRLQGKHPLSPSFRGSSIMGVDQGNNLHVTIGHPAGYRILLNHFEEIRGDEHEDPFLKLDILMKKYNVRMCFIDGVPNTHDAKKFALRFPGRVIVQFFQGPGQNIEKEVQKGTRTVKTISIDRNESLDDTVDHIKSGIMLLPPLAAGPVIKDVRKQLKKLIKEELVNAAGQTRLNYKPKVENHYGMSCNSVLQAYFHSRRHQPRGSGVMPVAGRIKLNGTTH